MPPRAKKVVEPQEEYDPFKPGQDVEPGGDEAQTELPPPWEVDDETNVNEGQKSPTDTEHKGKVVTVGSGEGKVVGTIKGGRDFDEPWIVLHCESLQELVDNLTDRELLGQAMDAAQKASKAFRDFRPAEARQNAPATSQGGSQPRTQGKPAQATEHPKGRKEYCEHGEMEFKSGLGKNGKPWGAFDCKTDPKGCPKGRVWDNDFGK